MLECELVLTFSSAASHTSADARASPCSRLSARCGGGDHGSRIRACNHERHCETRALLNRLALSILS